MTMSLMWLNVEEINNGTILLLLIVQIPLKYKEVRIIKYWMYLTYTFLIEKDRSMTTENGSITTSTVSFNSFCRYNISWEKDLLGS